MIGAEEGHSACAGLTAHGDEICAAGMGLDVEYETVFPGANLPAFAEGSVRH